MNVQGLNSFMENIPSLMEVMQEDLLITVFDIPKKEVIVAVAKGKLSEALNEKAGESFIIEKRPLLNAVKREKKQVVSLPPAESGISMKLFLTPVLDETGEVVAIVSIGKSIESERRIENITGTLFNSIEQLGAGIEEIAASSQQLATVIKETADFGEQSQKRINEINGIISEIKKISGHSNLLALNASIEAARAGDAGRGFDVVAKEMGKFSSLSKNSADNVAKSLLEMKGAIETINTKISQTSIVSENQAATTEQIAATTDEILGVARQLTDIAKINTAAETLAKLH